MADEMNTDEREAEAWLRDRYGAYRGHFAWRELEEAFKAGRASAGVASLSAAEPARGWHKFPHYLQNPDGRLLRTAADLLERHGYTGCSAPLRVMADALLNTTPTTTQGAAIAAGADTLGVYCGIASDDVTDPTHPRYVAGFKAGHAAGRKRASHGQAPAQPDPDGEAFRTAARLGLTLRFYGGCAQSSMPGAPSAYEVVSGQDRAAAMREAVERAAAVIASGGESQRLNATPSPQAAQQATKHWNPLEGGNPETALQMAAVIAHRDAQQAPAETMTQQEIWVAAGGNPGITPTRDDVLLALKTLDEVCDEAAAQQAPAGAADDPLAAFKLDQGFFSDAQIESLYEVAYGRTINSADALRGAVRFAKLLIQAWTSSTDIDGVINESNMIAALNRACDMVGNPVMMRAEIIAAFRGALAEGIYRAPAAPTPAQQAVEGGDAGLEAAAQLLESQHAWITNVAAANLVRSLAARAAQKEAEKL